MCDKITFRRCIYIMKNFFINLINSIKDFFKYNYQIALGAFFIIVQIIIYFMIFLVGLYSKLSLCVINFLFICPWIIFAISANIRNDKYHKFWFNTKNVKVILNSINSPLDPVDVVSKYEAFISFKRKDYSVVAKYFIDEKYHNSRRDYELATNGYSLYSFCEELSLITFCCDFCTGNPLSDPNRVIYFARYVYDMNISDYITDYYYENKMSTIHPRDLKELLAEYISFSLSNKFKLSFKRYILFAIEYCRYEAYEENISYNKYCVSDNRYIELLNFYNKKFSKNLSLTESKYDLNTDIYYFNTHISLFINDFEEITTQFQYPDEFKIIYRKEYNYVLLKKGSTVIDFIDKNIKDQDFYSKINNQITEYNFDNNKPFKKQFRVVGSEFDFRQHNLSTIYNGDTSVKLKTKLSDYSPDKTITVFINDLDIGYISYDDLKYFQKGNYNYRITNVNIKNISVDNGNKTYEATITVAFSSVISQKIMKSQKRMLL